MPQTKYLIQGQPWLPLTYKIIGLAMEVHNELGPGHREAIYHKALAVKLQMAGLIFEDEPYIPILMAENVVIGGNIPDLVVEETVIVELKARTHGMTRDDQAQVISYFAVLPDCPVALFLNFGRHRLEYRRLLPPKSIQAYRREKWNKKDIP